MQKLIQFKCKHCHKVRNTYDPAMEFCSSTCKSKFEYYEIMAPINITVMKQKMNLKRNDLHSCIVCGTESSNRKFCCEDCSKSHINKIRREKICENSKNNFMKEKKKPKYSFDQLNRMAEWKRINDDQSWLNRFQGQRMG